MTCDFVYILHSMPTFMFISGVLKCTLTGQSQVTDSSNFAFQAEFPHTYEPPIVT